MKQFLHEKHAGAEQGWRQRLWKTVFLADTPLGRRFDIVLLWAIVISVAVVILDSVESLHVPYQSVFIGIEWFFTILFTIEYILRILCVRRPFHYIFSFWGLVDLISVVPTYLSFAFAGTQSLMVVRGLRLLRIFRLLQLPKLSTGANVLLSSLSSSKHKIAVFLVSIVILVLLLGTIMYLIEGPKNGFTSIPKGVYWAIVTMTTVGYGDLVPKTVLGQLISSIVMIMGYGIIAVPTGIVTAEMTAQRTSPVYSGRCGVCVHTEHQAHAKFCHQCGEELAAHAPPPSSSQ